MDPILMSIYVVFFLFLNRFYKKIALKQFWVTKDIFENILEILVFFGRGLPISIGYNQDTKSMNRQTQVDT